MYSKHEIQVMKVLCPLSFPAASVTKDTNIVCVYIGTHLLADETALSSGQLTEVGVSNLTALGNVIQWQKVTYDFQYHTTEFDCNLVSSFFNL